jgi:GGDEF domain-containing protein
MRRRARARGGIAPLDELLPPAGCRSPVFVDVDNLKRINDDFDTRWATSSEKSGGANAKAASKLDTIARWGGRFVLLLPNVS